MPLPAEEEPKRDSKDEPQWEALRKALAPLNQELFTRLNIPSLEISEAEAVAVSHGGSLRFLQDRAPEAAETLALFHGGSLAAVTEKKNGLWSYGYVASRSF
jgi:hypothetical protein